MAQVKEDEHSVAGVRAFDFDSVTIFHVVTVAMSLGFLRGQIDLLRKFGADVHAVSSPSEELELFGEEFGISVHSANLKRKISPLSDLIALKQLCSLFRQFKPDIVHAHTPKGGLLGTIAARITGVPVVLYHMRGLPFLTQRGLSRAILKLSERVSCFCARRVLSVSRSNLDIAVAAGLCPKEKGRVLLSGSGQGVDADNLFNPRKIEVSFREEARSEWGVSSKDFVIGFIGRLVNDKGIRELIEAFEWLDLETSNEPFFFFFFPSEVRDSVDDCVLKKIDTNPRICHIGKVKKSSLNKYYIAMDLVVLPSYREGFPNVPLEAAAMELPVVSTKVPGCMDAVVDGETGVLVESRSSTELKRAIERYASSSDLRRKHGLAGRKRVERCFREEYLRDAIFQEYAELMREGQ